MTVLAFDKNGKIQTPSAAEYAKADEETAILAYTHGKMSDGRPYYAYVAVKPSKYKEFFLKSAARESMVLGDYGTVVAGGFEAEPPLSVIQKMREMGFDDTYEEKLKEEARRALRAHQERQELERIESIVHMLKKKNPAAEG